MTCTDSLIIAPIHLFPSAANSVNISKHLDISVLTRFLKMDFYLELLILLSRDNHRVGPVYIKLFRIILEFTFGDLGSVL